MAHSMTIRTQQTVTTTGSTIIINTGHLKTWGGILKLMQVVLGTICVGIIGSVYPYKDSYYHTYNTEKSFFFVIATTFMIGSFIILLSCLISFSTAAILSKTIYEFVYHFIASLLIFAASLTLLIQTSNYYRGSSNYDLLLAASIIGLINTALYVCSTIFAFRNYRGA